jgi:hypothetical protein
MLTTQLAAILRKLGTSTSSTICILHNSRELTTMTLYLNVVVYIKLQRDILKCSVSCRVSELFTVQNECSFYSVQER